MTSHNVWPTPFGDGRHRFACLTRRFMATSLIDMSHLKRLAWLKAGGAHLEVPSLFEVAAINFHVNGSLQIRDNARARMDTTASTQNSAEASRKGRMVRFAMSPGGIFPDVATVTKQDIRISYLVSTV